MEYKNRVENNYKFKNQAEKKKSIIAEQILQLLAGL